MTDLPNDNCYVVAEVPPLKTSLIVARGDDGKVRPLERLPSRRAVKDQSGCRKALTCGFHGWTYATDGRLNQRSPTRRNFPDLDPEQHLVPVHTEVWEDYVFVNFDPKPRGAFRDRSASSRSARASSPIGSASRAPSHRREKSNWNIAINSFSEGYHAAYVHRKTVPDYQGGKQNPQRHRAYLEIIRASRPIPTAVSRM